MLHNARYFREQNTYSINAADIQGVGDAIRSLCFKGNDKNICLKATKTANQISLETIYYVGIDWLTPEQAVYIEPKLNENEQTDYIGMLLSAIRHPDVSVHVEDLYEIKLSEAPIEIDQQQDLLTPLLVVHFINTVKQIVRKGLKKSYYKVEQNLYSRIKGKIDVARTIKECTLKSKPLNTYCSYDEFGINGLENRLIKKAMTFVQRYLHAFPNIDASKFCAESFRYIMPAFEKVSEDVNVEEVKHLKKNVFYKDYEVAITLAKDILRRFGYNITNADRKKIKTPPFWIDMSKLFELYVLGLLKDRFGKHITYHDYLNHNELDYVLDAVTPSGAKLQFVIDAKYKTKYATGYEIDDIRQVSGYARLRKVYERLGKPSNELVSCIIIYPNKNGHIKLDVPFDIAIWPDAQQIKQFTNFYKLPVKLPTLSVD